MRKLLTLFLIAAIAFTSGFAWSAERPNGKKGIYFVQALTGGGANALDSLDITGTGNPNQYDLVDGDTAIYSFISGTDIIATFYVFDADGTDATFLPRVIRPNDYSTAGVWRLPDANFVKVTADSFETNQSATLAGWWIGKELSGNGSNYMGWEVPDSITDDLVYKMTDTNPTAGQVMLFGAPSGGESAQTWATPVTANGSTFQIYVLDDCTTATGMSQGDICLEY